MNYKATDQETYIAIEKWTNLLNDIEDSIVRTTPGVFTRPSIIVNNDIVISIQAGYGMRSSLLVPNTNGKDIREWKTTEMGILYKRKFIYPSRLDVYGKDNYFEHEGPGNHIPINLAFGLALGIFFKHAEQQTIDALVGEQHPVDNGDINLHEL